MKNPKEIIEKLELTKHPEGGYFKEIYRSNESISHEALPERFSGDRSFGTSIYFLLKENEISAWHKVKQDEIWHHYLGSQLILHTIDEKGNYKKATLGKNFEENEQPQIVVEQGTWMAAEVLDKSSFVLVGCTTAPGFDFQDFELASAKQLSEIFPKHKEIAHKYALQNS